MSKVVGCGLGLAALLVLATPAHADEDATTLEAQLKHDTTELSTSDCISACKALGSIRRAADRICELAPGPRCDAARAKADDATKRVAEACPSCIVAAQAPPEPDRRAPAEAATAEAAPPRGGCRSCATVGAVLHGPDRGDLAVFALAALAVLKKRRRRL